MKFSIVTVSFNSAATIRAAMDSVRRQRRDGFEVEYVVVDGGSTDGTADEVRRFAGEVDAESPDGFSFKWSSGPDRGIYDAMNKGIAASTGDVVGIVNADDRLDGDDVLAKLAAEFAADPAGSEAVYGDIRFARDGRTVRYVSGRYFRKWMFRFATFPPHPSTFIRRECFLKWGAYDVSYRISGDFDLVMRFMLAHGMKARYVPICTHVMTPGGASTTASRHAEMELEDIRSIRAHGLWTCRPLTWLRYPLKVAELVLGRTSCR